MPEERLGRGAVPANVAGAQCAAVAPATGVGAHGLDRPARAASAPRDHRALQGQGRRTGGGGASLSGGNLQKFIVGREIVREPKVLVVAQPTWGVDVGAAAQIRAELVALRDAGCAVLVISEELDELFEICDRLVVIAKGRLSPPMPAREHQRRADRRVDERHVATRRQRAAAAGGYRCLGSRARPSRRR